MPETNNNSSKQASKTELPVNLEQELATGYAIKTIRQKAHQLVGHGRLVTSDVEDIKMDLITALIENFSTFDPQVACWKVFVTTIVERYASKIVNARKARKRQFSHHVVSLASLVEDEDGEIVPLATQIGVENVLSMQGVEQMLFDEQMTLNLDVADTIDQLPFELRPLCEELKIDNVFAVAKKIGISRIYLREKIYRIRECFENHGVNTFFPKYTATSPLKKEV